MGCCVFFHIFLTFCFRVILQILYALANGGVGVVSHVAHGVIAVIKVVQVQFLVGFFRVDCGCIISEVWIVPSIGRFELVHTRSENSIIFIIEFERNQTKTIDTANTFYNECVDIQSPSAVNSSGVSTGKNISCDRTTKEKVYNGCRYGTKLATKYTLEYDQGTGYKLATGVTSNEINDYHYISVDKAKYLKNRCLVGVPVVSSSTLYIDCILCEKGFKKLYNKTADANALAYHTCAKFIVSECDSANIYNDLNETFVSANMFRGRIDHALIDQIDLGCNKCPSSDYIRLKLTKDMT